MSENHCQDCCCAKAWEALDISEHTGKSIPEHIEDMRDALEDALATWEDRDIPNERQVAWWKKALNAT